MSDSDYIEVEHSYSLKKLFQPTTKLFSFFLNNREDDIKWHEAMLYTVSCKKAYRYASQFSDALRSIMKKLKINAGVGVLEKHPNRRGLHIHMFLWADCNRFAEKGWFFHQSIATNVKGYLAYLDYMYKGVRSKCLFSQLLCNEEDSKEVEEKCETAHCEIINPHRSEEGTQQ